MKVAISEIKTLKNRLREINDHDLNDIVFIDDDGNEVPIDPKLREEFRYVGLNNVDFIITDFYKDGFKDEALRPST